MDKHIENTQYYDPDRCEDEIELIDLLRVIWKWRYLILGGTVACMLIVGIISLLSPKIYRVNMVIDSGVAEKSLDEGAKPLVQPGELAALIESGVLNHRVLANMDKSDGEISTENLAVKAEVRKGTNLLEVSLDTEVPKAGEEILRALHKVLLQEYSKRVEYFKAEFEAKTLPKTRELANLKAELIAKKEELASLPERAKAEKEEFTRELEVLHEQKLLSERRVSELRGGVVETQKEIDRVSDEIGLLTVERNQLLAEENETLDSARALLLSSALQQLHEHLDRLRNRVLVSKNEIKQELMKIHSIDDDIYAPEAVAENTREGKDRQEIFLKRELNNLKDDIEAIERELFWQVNEGKAIRNIGIIEPLSGHKELIKPKTRPMTALAAVVGLFMSLFLSFFIEYISKYRHRESERAPSEEANP